MIVYDSNGNGHVYGPGGIFGSNGIKIDTSAVRHAVDALKKINNDIDREFSSVDAAIRRLDGKWNGPASNAAMSKYNEIKKAYIGSGGSRYQVVEQYCKFLAQAVAIDYETVEQTNTKLSDMFK